MASRFSRRDLIKAAGTATAAGLLLPRGARAPEKTKKYFGFSDSYVPDPVNYRKSLFDQVGMKPDTWDDIRVAGKKIKDKTGIPVGIGQAQEIDTAMAMRAVLYSFGGSEQDEQGKLVLRSKGTLEAVK